MNLIILHEQDFAQGENRVRLTGRRLRHVLSVHKSVVGDTLRVGLLNGNAGSGLITTLTDDELVMTVTLDRPPPPPLPLTLLIALPRPKSLRKVLQAVTAMGVKKIVLFNSRRVEKSYWQSPLLDDERLREEMILGLEQARDTVLPHIVTKKRFKWFVEDDVPQLTHGTMPLVAHPDAAQICPCRPQRAVTLAVGPEGGFIPHEIDLLQAAGFTPVSLGERPLRVEHAVTALIGRLM